MSTTPSGRLVRTGEGRDLVIIRTFHAPIEDVWASITEPERTARWFGGWKGEAGPGRTIRYAMAFEAGAPEADMTIEACEPPHHLAVRATDDYGNWHLEAHLREADGITELRFTHHLDPQTKIGEVGPGWEYYLDNLLAYRTRTPLPQFTDYYPAQSEYFVGLEAEASA